MVGNNTQLTVFICFTVFMISTVFIANEAYHAGFEATNEKKCSTSILSLISPEDMLVADNLVNFYRPITKERIIVRYLNIGAIK